MFRKALLTRTSLCCSSALLLHHLLRLFAASFEVNMFVKSARIPCAESTDQRTQSLSLSLSSDQLMPLNAKLGHDCTAFSLSLTFSQRSSVSCQQLVVCSEDSQADLLFPAEQSKQLERGMFKEDKLILMMTDSMWNFRNKRLPSQAARLEARRECDSPSRDELASSGCLSIS